MNKFLILGLIMIAASIAVFYELKSDVSTYATFHDALASGNRVKVVGTLDKSQPTVYDAQHKPNEFVFHMIDTKGTKMQVTLLKPKPQDFERSEQIVVTGQIKANEFIASEILMKCPSKYKEEEIKLRSS